MWAAGLWGVICKLSTSLLTSLFGSTQLVNASLTLTSSWRFCHTEFLWKGYQTLFSLLKHKRKKAVWPHETILSPPTQGFITRRFVRVCGGLYCHYFPIRWGIVFRNANPHLSPPQLVPVVVGYYIDMYTTQYKPNVATHQLRLWPKLHNLSA